MIARAIQLTEGEEVIETIRRHWFHIAVEGGILVCVYVLMIAVVIVMNIYVSDTDTLHMLPLGIFILAFIGLLFWMKFFAAWSDHWLDAWVITNKRIIDIEQYGFFRRQVSSFPLNRIQDVTFTVSGIIATWLHFGDIRIQTASISDDLIMRQIPFPEDVKEHIISILEKSSAV